MVRMSPDGRVLVARGDSGIKLLDPGTGAQLGALPISGETSVSFSADGKRLAAANTKSVSVFDAESWQTIATIQFPNTHWIRAVEIAPSGDVVAVARAEGVETIEEIIEIVDIGSRQSMGRFAGVEIASALHFSPDEKRLAAICQNGSVRLWDVDAAKTLAELPSEHREQRAFWAPRCCFSSDSQLMATCTTLRTVTVMNAANGNVENRLRGHTAQPMMVEFTNDGKQVISIAPVGANLLGGGLLEVKFWDRESGMTLDTLGVDLGSWSATCADLSPDEESLVLGDMRGTVKRVRLDRRSAGFTLTGHTGGVRSVAVSPDGATLASGGADADGKGELFLWDLVEQKHRRALDGHARAVSSVVFSQNGRTLASGSSDGTVQIWDVASAKSLSQLKIGARVNGLDLSPDGSRLAVTCGLGADVYNVETNSKICHCAGHRGEVLAVSFISSGGRLLTASADRTLRIWNSQNGQLVQSIERPAAVQRVELSSDGKTLATASYNAVQLWDVSSEKLTPLQILNVRGTRGPASDLLDVEETRGLAFHPNGREIATTTEDRTIRFWDLATGQQLLTLSGHTDDVTALAFSPEGDLLVSAGDDKLVRLWNGNRHESSFPDSSPKELKP